MEQKNNPVGRCRCDREAENNPCKQCARGAAAPRFSTKPSIFPRQELTEAPIAFEAQIAHDFFVFISRKT